MSTGHMRRGSSWCELSREGYSAVIRVNVEGACRVAFVLHHIIAVVRGFVTVFPKSPIESSALSLTFCLQRPSRSWT